MKRPEAGRKFPRLGVSGRFGSEREGVPSPLPFFYAKASKK
jgi:hypothetical protein